MWWIVLDIIGGLLIATLLVAAWILFWRYRNSLASMLELDDREGRLGYILLDNINLYREGVALMPVPQIVVSQSYFVKSYFGSILPDLRSKLFHFVVPHEMLVNRARRRVIVQLLEQAEQMGFNAVCNLQIEMTDVGASFNASQRAMVIITATGTGYRLE